MVLTSVKNKSFIRGALAIAAVIAAAALCRWTVTVTNNGFIEQLANLLRILLYIGLFAMWGISVRRRVIQLQVCNYLISIAALMVLWLITRELRWHIVFSGDIKRILWYAYYIPTLMILLLTFLVSMSLGKPDDFRLPKTTALLYVPTVALILLVMTNDFHQAVFRFPPGVVRSEANYSYGPGYYLLAVWGILLAGAAFIVMLSKCRLPRTGRFLWLPLIPLGLTVLYVVLYAARVPFVHAAFGDLTVTECLLFAAFLESCIGCGLIQSNSRYADLFRACRGISAQITDNDYDVRYAAVSAETVSKYDMMRAASGPVILPGGKRLHNMSVSGGHAIWSEDISELLKTRESLEDTGEELNERREMLQMQYEQEKEYRRVLEQNRLYDLLQRQIRPQLDEVSRLAAVYEASEDGEEKRRILAKIVILGSYIKRRKDFVLLMEGSEEIPADRLTSALEESFRSLALGGIRGVCLVSAGRDNIDGAVMTRAYDFFESVLESALDTLRYITVHFVAEEDGLCCRVTTDCRFETGGLTAVYPRMRVADDDEGGICCILPLSGGDGI
ncbi:MAG: hypothetical protein IKR93_02085 [Firmicutes bacterium]|nr:hypothetical protein [Bacillota bacterium]